MIKLKTEFDIIDARSKVSERKSDTVREMTRLLTRINNSYDPELREELILLEAEDKLLSWFLDEILIE